jgi:hypothetical protein
MGKKHGMVHCRCGSFQYNELLVVQIQGIRVSSAVQFLIQYYSPLGLVGW